MEIKDYVPGDEIAILDLFEKVFGKSMSLKYWNWRFRDNPINKFMIKLMWDDSQLVGHYAVCPVLLQKKQTLVLSGLSMTTMTHPEYTGLGIFQHLSQELYQDIQKQHDVELVWGFPNQNSHRNFIKNLSWKNITIIPMLSLPVAEIKPIQSSLLRSIDFFNEVHEKSWTFIFRKYLLKVNKSSTYLNWRYVNIPTVSYKIIEVQNGTSGFLVIKEFTIEQSKKKQIDIVEWSIDKDERLTKVIFQHLAAIYPSELYEKFNIWMPLNDERHLYLEKLGFTQGMPLTYFACKEFNEGLFVSENDCWIQLGDSDVY